MNEADSGTLCDVNRKMGQSGLRTDEPVMVPIDLVARSSMMAATFVVIIADCCEKLVEYLRVWAIDGANI